MAVLSIHLTQRFSYCLLWAILAQPSFSAEDDIGNSTVRTESPFAERVLLHQVVDRVLENKFADEAERKINIKFLDDIARNVQRRIFHSLPEKFLLQFELEQHIHDALNHTKQFQPTDKAKELERFVTLIVNHGSSVPDLDEELFRTGLSKEGGMNTIKIDGATGPKALVFANCKVTRIEPENAGVAVVWLSLEFVEPTDDDHDGLADQLTCWKVLDEQVIFVKD
jgi:hypothetical protein